MIGPREERIGVLLLKITPAFHSAEVLVWKESVKVLYLQLSVVTILGDSLKNIRCITKWTFKHRSLRYYGTRIALFWFHFHSVAKMYMGRAWYRVPPWITAALPAYIHCIGYCQRHRQVGFWYGGLCLELYEVSSAAGHVYDPLVASSPWSTRLLLEGDRPIKRATDIAFDCVLWLI